MLKMYTHIFILLLFSYKVVSDDCIVHNFENGLDSFNADSSMCQAGLIWELGDYASLSMEGPHASSTKFVTPIPPFGCMDTDMIPLGNGGTLDVMVYMEIEDASTQLSITAVQPSQSGNTVNVGGISLDATNSVRGWQRANTTLFGPTSYYGYISIVGLVSSSSVIFLDSVRYIPRNVDEESCPIYQQDEITTLADSTSNSIPDTTEPITNDPIETTTLSTTETFTTEEETDTTSFPSITTPETTLETLTTTETNPETTTQGSLLTTTVDYTGPDPYPSTTDSNPSTTDNPQTTTEVSIETTTDNYSENTSESASEYQTETTTYTSEYQTETTSDYYSELTTENDSETSTSFPDITTNYETTLTTEYSSVTMTDQDSSSTETITTATSDFEDISTEAMSTQSYTTTVGYEVTDTFTTIPDDAITVSESTGNTDADITTERPITDAEYSFWNALTITMVTTLSLIVLCLISLCFYKIGKIRASKEVPHVVFTNYEDLPKPILMPRVTKVITNPTKVGLDFP